MKHARVAVSLAIPALLMLAVPGEAGAKGVGIDQIQASGPGLDRPLKLTIEEIGTRHTWNAIARTGQQLMSDEREAAPPRSVGDLGPRYLLSTTLSTFTGRRSQMAEDVIVQDFYPFGPGGPVVFTPPDQQRHEVMGRDETVPVASGWNLYPSEMLRILQENGFPAEAPAVPGAGAASPTSSGPGPWAIVLVGAAIGAAAALIVALVRRRPRAAA